ncbi:hypothetical protein FisN_21Lh170 [Fistulifera solaris]|uniref:Uncharacterized protein n=1 Tax=Fistulifera solaris TaxID=1519565 RepID=A0A1Z5J9P1_FISSO|nr:hypothetical protein FisN_21Lh170 [Fistulifera solaris]|eukprot:GAX10471.1 hypothetical protein FisN_21Lh170 [Fistulifera solaris]
MTVRSSYCAHPHSFAVLKSVPGTEECNNMSDQAHESSPTIDGLSHDIAAGLAALLHESRQLASMLLRKEQQHSPAIRKRLLQLCDRVAALEHTVEMTQEKLEEEAAMIHEMELLEKRAIERRHALILMLDQAQRGENISLSSSILQQQSSNLTRFPSSATQLPVSNEPPGSSDIRHGFERRQQFLSTRPKTPPAVVDTISLESWPIQFERITKDELELSIPRTMRSGISVAMLNDALSDLEQLLEQTGDSWVTEQEIRQYCSFFRYGEATARAMLLLLCNLHRVTQRPEKGGDFIYEVPVLRDKVSPAV